MVVMRDEPRRTGTCGLELVQRDTERCRAMPSDTERYRAIPSDQGGGWVIRGLHNAWRGRRYSSIIESCGAEAGWLIDARRATTSMRPGHPAA